MVELERLRKLSALAGADPLLVQGPGGNTSLKHGGIMWIKASGTWLAEAERRDIFVPLDHRKLMEAFAGDDPACETCVDFVRGDLNQSQLRPSIETTVHALMQQAVVVHVHCVNTIAWAIRADAKARLGERLAGFNWAFIPYARPGLPLAHAIATRLRPGIDVLVLGNHGLVVAGETVDEAKTLLDRVVTVLHLSPRPPVPPDLTAITRYRLAASNEAHALATDPFALLRARSEVFYPDHAVFLGVGVATEIASNAPAVAIPGKGVLIKSDAKPAVEPMVRCLADVMRRVEPGTPLVSLTRENIAELLNWDAEKYRQTLSPSPH
jgi:rhamnose utilization protein RhaD (predicted bifunctional aldolase and dehydrogenase)